jgi:gamma-glutamyltranspeptidase/glutathione hydrolase
MVCEVNLRPKTRGVVAAGDRQTAAAGAYALAQGGSAVDAAVAAAFAAFVCELPLSSPFGGGVLLAGPSPRELRQLDLFARTPGLGGERPQRMEFDPVEVDFGVTSQVFHVGRASAAVPVALPGLLEAHRRWGRLPLQVLVEPAVELGRRGYVVSAVVAYVSSLLASLVRRTPECAALYTLNGELAQAGMRLHNPALADVLERFAQRPAVVEELYAAFRCEFGTGQGGLITPLDVERIEVVEGAPLVTAHGGWTLHTMSTPSSGGVLVAVGVRLLQGVGALPFLSAEHVLALARVEAQLALLRDRSFDERCREPEFLRGLLDTDRISALRAAEGASDPGGLLGSTTHISVLDEHGGVAALTITNGEGSGQVLSGTGIHVNNLLGEEDIHVRGFHVDAPGTRLITMMAPTVLDGPGGTIALGSGGSNRLRNAILCVVSHLIEHRADPAVAVDAARVHVEAVRAAGSTTLQLAFEPGLDEAASLALSRAHPEAFVMFPARNMYFGGVHVATRTERGFAGAGDGRRGGSVCVVE